MQKAIFRFPSCLVLLAIVAGALTIGFAQIAHPAHPDGTERPLTGTKWELVELDNRPVQGDYYLALKQTESLSSVSTGSIIASDWCNDYTGVYEAGHHSLHMRLVASTLMACRVGSNQVPFIATLTHTSAFRIYDGVLELLNRDGDVTARLAAAQN